jgi:hypothetical protein
MLDPAPDGDVIHGQAALRDDLLQIAVAQRIPQVPPHAEDDDDIGEVSPLEWGWSGPDHDLTVPKAPGAVCNTSGYTFDSSEKIMGEFRLG